MELVVYRTDILFLTAFSSTFCALILVIMVLHTSIQDRVENMKIHSHYVGNTSPLAALHFCFVLCTNEINIYCFFEAFLDEVPKHN